MLNKKGITIVEIVISVVLIAIIMVFLYGMLITVRNEDEAMRQTSTMMVNQAIITRDVHADFIDLVLERIEPCPAPGTPGHMEMVQILPAGFAFGNCVRFQFRESREYGYLFYYRYRYRAGSGTRDDEWVNAMGYRRGNRRVLRDTPLEWRTGQRGSVRRTCWTSNLGAHQSITIHMPAYNEFGVDFGINLTYVAHRGAPTNHPPIFIGTTPSPNTNYHFTFDGGTGCT